MKNENTVCGRIKLWKWILLFVGGSFLFLIFMAFAEAIPLMLQERGKTTGMGIASLVTGSIMLGLWACWIRVTEKRWPSELGLSGFPKSMGLGAVVGFGMFFVITLILCLCGMYHFEGINSNVLSLLAPFCFFYVIAVCEEILFRGFIFRMIDDRFGLWPAIIVSAIIFGFVHISNDNATVWSSVSIAIEAGIMLALAYKYSRDLWLPIAIHWAWNFSQGNIFGFAVSGNDAGKTLIQATVSGPDLITGGSFGPEASVVAAVLGLIVAWLFYRKK